jgi:hypothetical protein
MCVRSNGVRDADERSLGPAISEIRGLFTVDSGWGGCWFVYPATPLLPVFTRFTVPITRPRTGRGRLFFIAEPPCPWALRSAALWCSGGQPGGALVKRAAGPVRSGARTRARAGGAIRPGGATRDPGSRARSGCVLGCVYRFSVFRSRHRDTGRRTRRSYLLGGSRNNERTLEHHAQPGDSPGPLAHWFLYGVPGSLAPLWETPQPFTL